MILLRDVSARRRRRGRRDNSRQANCTPSLRSPWLREGKMARSKAKAYKEQSFDHLHGLDGISDDQVAEHLKLYSGYVKQVNALNQQLAEMLGRGKASGEDPATERLTNHWISLHQDGVPAGFKPLLVMDVWEHAFMRDYKVTDKAKYVEAFFRNIDWQVVDRRLREQAAVRPAAAA